MPANIIELYNRKADRIALMAICRVMSIGHLDEPNDDAKYKAVLREWLPKGMRQGRTTAEGGNDCPAVVPEVFRPIIFRAFQEDLFVMVQISLGCIESAVILEQPEFYDAEGYVKRNGYPKA